MKLIYATLLLITLLGCTEKNNQLSTNFETKVEALATFTDTSTADPDFGDPITTSTTRIFTFKNTGNTPGPANPNFTGSNPTDFSIILQTGCAMVNPGSTCTVRVNFNPSGKTTGRYSADLNIGNSIFKSLQTRVDTSNGTTGGGTSTIEASVSGSVISNPLDYGSFSGTQTSTKIIRLKNTGTASTGPHTAALSDTDFSFTLNGCNNKTLAPNAYCDVRVTFNASSKTAQDYLTDLTFAGSTFPLKATVTAPGGTTTSGGGTPNIAILEGTNPAADPLNYGSFSGTQSLTKILTIKNNGTSSVTVNPTLSDASFKFILNSCANKTLTPNGSCSVRVSFSASGQTSGIKTSTLTVHPSKTLTLTASVSGSSNQITVTFDVPPDTLMVTNEIYPPSLPNYMECSNYGASSNRQCQLTFTQGTDINIELQYDHDTIEPVAWIDCPQVEPGGSGQWFCQLSLATSNFTLGMQVNPVAITYQSVFDSWSTCDAQVCQGQGNQTRNLIDCEKIVNGQNQGSAPIFQCMMNLNSQDINQSCPSPSGDVIVTITGGEQTFHCDEGSSTQNFVSVSCNQGYSSQGEECVPPLPTVGMSLFYDYEMTVTSQGCSATLMGGQSVPLVFSSNFEFAIENGEVINPNTLIPATKEEVSSFICSELNNNAFFDNFNRINSFFCSIGNNTLSNLFNWYPILNLTDVVFDYGSQGINVFSSSTCTSSPATGLRNASFSGGSTIIDAINPLAFGSSGDLLYMAGTTSSGNSNVTRLYKVNIDTQATSTQPEEIDSGDLFIDHGIVSFNNNLYYTNQNNGSPERKVYNSVNNTVQTLNTGVVSYMPMLKVENSRIFTIAPDRFTHSTDGFNFTEYIKQAPLGTYFLSLTDLTIVNDFLYTANYDGVNNLIYIKKFDFQNNTETLIHTKPVDTTSPAVESVDIIIPTKYNKFYHTKSNVLYKYENDIPTLINIGHTGIILRVVFGENLIYLVNRASGSGTAGDPFLFNLYSLNPQNDQINLVATNFMSDCNYNYTYYHEKMINEFNNNYIFHCRQEGPTVARIKSVTPAGVVSTIYTSSTYQLAVGNGFTPNDIHYFKNNKGHGFTSDSKQIIKYNNKQYFYMMEMVSGKTLLASIDANNNVNITNSTIHSGGVKSIINVKNILFFPGLSPTSTESPNSGSNELYRFFEN